MMSVKLVLRIIKARRTLRPIKTQVSCKTCNCFGTMHIIFFGCPYQAHIATSAMDHGSLSPQISDCFIFIFFGVTMWNDLCRYSGLGVDWDALLRADKEYIDD
jgi:hypothetical protein